MTLSGDSPTWKVSTTAAHGFHVGQSVAISGITSGETRYNGTWVVQSLTSATTFTIDASSLSGNPGSAV